MSYQIKDLYVEYEKQPLGLDEKQPRFSWIFSQTGKDMHQRACRILVTKTGKEEVVVWDSEVMETGESRGISYDGIELEACTSYMVLVQTWNEKNEYADAKTWFETGLMNWSDDPKDIKRAWEGAEWIAAPRFSVNAKSRGVFALETELKLKKGTNRAGIVFGANDFRLLDESKNEYGLAGENYIRYEVNLNGLCDKKNDAVPTLDIYRVGYAKEDRADIPFASVPIIKMEDETATPLLTVTNAWDFHTLRIEVDGNNAFTYLDGILVDAVRVKDSFCEKIAGRTLNPRGHNDVLTYPRLNEIGFFAGEGGAYFKILAVSNLRTPSALFIKECPDGWHGKNSIFTEKLPVKDGCFWVEDQQITADPSNTSIPMFRTVFDAGEELPEKARLYITSRGIYDCKVNGKEVTNQLLAPGNTQYDKRLNYQTYDVTGLIQLGKNGIGVTLGSGWWSDAQTFTVRNYNFWGDKEALFAKLVLTYADGSRKVYVTNRNEWKYYGEGPYVYAGFFLGEEVDGRKMDIYEAYSNPEFDASDWEMPVEYCPEPIEAFQAMPGFGRPWPAVNFTNPQILGGYDAPVHVVDKKSAKSCVSVEKGVYIYDIGQEMAGVPRIQFHEKEGTRVTIRYAEICYPDMEEYRENVGKLMVENYRDATSTDFYICSGKTGEVYQPRFTYHGYRYIEISGVVNPPKLQEIESLQYSSIISWEGRFECSNPLLNRFAENVKWSQYCNFINIPTDCPQRNERMGWVGDTHVFCHTALQNGFLKQFYERNLQAMADLQEETGRLPEIAPVGSGFGGLTYECASIFMANELYEQYGDKRLIETFYPVFMRYMDYMSDKGLPGRGDKKLLGPLGDWLAPEETDLQLMWHAFYYREAVLMQTFSDILGLKKEKEHFHDLADRVKRYWNDAFLNPEDGRTRTLDGELCDTQCSYVLALEYDIAQDKQKMEKHLLRKTRELNHTVGTGFFGTGLLNRALCKAGCLEDAYRLMMQTECPSWLYPVTQGATSIWEHWDSFTKEKGFGGYNAMNSFNHYSLGSVLSWMYEWILGIRRLPEYPGYSHFLLQPEAGINNVEIAENLECSSLDYAQGSVSSPYGTISSAWKKAGNQFEYRCEIPGNTSATVILPDGSVHEIGSGKYEFFCAI